MNKNVAMKWIKALRSGKYKQTISHLKDDDGYCCLGVLCSISGKKNWSSSSYLTKNVQEWAGMKTHDPSFGKDISKKLSFLNDVNFCSFEEIADVIEKNWKKL